jgi:hypothetical protein
MSEGLYGLPFRLRVGALISTLRATSPHLFPITIATLRAEFEKQCDEREKHTIEANADAFRDRFYRVLTDLEKASVIKPTHEITARKTILKRIP